MQTFHVERLRAKIGDDNNPFVDGNTLRGALGSALKSYSESDYARYFAPQQHCGPSGFRNLPRPFVLRLRQQPGVIQINVFAAEAVPAFVAALHHMHVIQVGDIQSETLAIPIHSTEADVKKVRVAFLTPMELKGANEPAFGALLSRLRDRVSNLRTQWGEGPLELDFKAFGERADHVRMTHCQLNHVAGERVSRATGQRHSLSGFTGFAEYEGSLSEFIPYLEIGRHTGVGRQTVWGKGEIAYETTD